MKTYETTIIWGKRKLAYNIRKRRDGTYIHIKHKSPPELIGEMDRRFRLNEGVLRHLTVLAVKESPRAEEPGRAAEPAAAAAAGAAHATQSEEKV
ncbi:MAG: 30S ribosomal protein S6 [Candidatus Eisenbacteria bacterium]|uniref:Small ribosomal subunit protein bS6 n=1 Tax=Eiseniibacteriota bacterium TaxID=2212470 RepID=A0A538TBU1_UNCEI|nr:MAG: 30S ribosomal protein S6 [Candidatus Eisenbacteria bacterium]